MLLKHQNWTIATHCWLGCHNTNYNLLLILWNPTFHRNFCFHFTLTLSNYLWYRRCFSQNRLPSFGFVMAPVLIRPGKESWRKNTFLCHAALYVIVKIAIINTVSSCSLSHHTQMHQEDLISLVLTVLSQQVTNFRTSPNFQWLGGIHYTNQYNYLSIFVRTRHDRKHVTFTRSSRCTGIPTFPISVK